MPTVTLPDGSTRSYDAPVTPAAVAADIGPGLAKAAMLAVVDGVEWDLTREIDSDASLALVTAKDDAILATIRHDAAHVMAEAVLELYPETQVTIGPSIENGFYYDFHRETPFSEDDLAAIEARMHDIVDRDEEIIRNVWTRDEAVAFYKKNDEPFKIELVEAIPEGETVTFYRQGDFIDLCRGPHLPSTGRMGHAFKLMSVAGAYWRGDSDRPMLQRIYGTAWRTEKELNAYLHMLEEAEKRDHRKLGRQLNFFHLQEEAAGSVFWHPNGWTIYREIETYMRRRLEEGGYAEVKTPQLVDRALWEASGHWDKFRENMFTAEAEDDRTLALKPMNCPCHVQIFRQGIKSYRDLPLRMAEFGSCHRNEPSGALHGIMRVRAFTQDDAHIFCTEDQITSESVRFCELLQSIYADFGFEDVRVKFSDRPEVRAGEDDVWDRAESALTDACEAAELETTLNPGEGAFYGPKLEFVLRDAIGRDWQCGTLQVDFVLPDRLDAEYVAEDGARHRPVMLHRAILGSLERWIGIIIEQYSGRMPPWLAPVQVVVASITDSANGYAEQVADAFRAAGMRVESDLRNEKISYKVREHSVMKVPYILAVGGREAEAGTVALRRLGSNEQQVIDMDEALATLRGESLPPDLARRA
ncbi:MAG: threonine--tRNA ligase [Pseudomonadota bacterium]|nr:threonine--tRNA ligase [Pseudomonadota bacterium]MEC8106074.1 threonine--tRNA ligase [Pseudomonadota bacterium]MEC8216337.1 threonine--tRNA ligase [Pseudomonadota bacterium]MEC8270629.1 threonine--tRNA ligase [Pseudomonadota bacterium]MEC8309035.1 threonine--tRNA ligase [Pseudomonadota bacterium]